MGASSSKRASPEIAIDGLGTVKHYQVLVLGFGTSAGYFAGELAKDPKAPKLVAFVGREPVVPYERPALSKGYLYPPGGIKSPLTLKDIYAGAASNLPLQGPDWYANRGWTTYLESTVSKVDMDKGLCTITQGQGSPMVVHYDHLVVALGQVEKKLPIENSDLDGVCYVRSEAEASTLVKRVEKITGRQPGMTDLPPPKGRIVIVGAGYLGVELITAMAGWGFEEVCVVILADIMLSKMAWPRVAREKMNKAILDRAPNVKLYGGCSVEKFEAKEGTRSLQAVIIDDGGNGISLDSHVRLEAELCVVCVGSHISPLQSQIIEANKLHSRRDESLITDDTLRTSHPSRRVWAMGESALPECGVVAARQMGAACARSVAAAVNKRKEPPYALETVARLEYHYSRFFEYTPDPIIWQSYGVFSVSPGVREAVGYGLANSFSKGFGYFWFDPRSRKVVSTFCACDGKSKLFEAVSKIAMDGEDIDVAMKTVYELTR